ncbi:MAG: ATP-binding protein [Pseudomonadota bacterium]
MSGKDAWRRLLPDSIVGRTVLVLVVGLLLSHAIALSLYSGNRLETLIAIAGREASERLAAAAEAARAATTRDDMRAARLLGGPNLRLAWSEKPLVTVESDTVLARILRDRLSRRLGAGADVRVAVSGEQAFSGPVPGEGPMGPMSEMGRMPMGPMMGWGEGRFAWRAHEAMHGAPGRVAVWISVGFADPDATQGTGGVRWLNLFMPLEAGESLWAPRFGFSFLVLTALALGLTVWAIRRAAAPLKTFAAAARRLGADAGADRGAPPLPLDGPREVREAATAFNDMQARIRRFVEDRTRMIAAISHDLRTPITRLRLRAELMEDGVAKDKMLADLDEMEAMVSATLAFARDEADRPASAPFDIAGLLKELVADGIARGLKGGYTGPDARVVPGDALALKRAFANILDNAWRYGGAARVRLEDKGLEVEATVDDDGPGIPDAERENVFRPFYRIEGSRSRETGGTGLGLALVRSAVLAHGGTIRLITQPEGGLSVRIVLPG